MINFLEETKQEMKRNGLKYTDIIYIGDKQGDYTCSWEEFQQLANFEYDDGFGWQEIKLDLQIIFTKHRAFIRQEYDGSEWWEFITTAIPDGRGYKLRSLKRDEGI